MPVSRPDFTRMRARWWDASEIFSDDRKCLFPHHNAESRTVRVLFCRHTSRKLHMRDDIIPKFAAFDLCCASHLSREIVGHTLACNRAVQTFQD
jgi:hypothetical protein